MSMKWILVLLLLLYAAGAAATPCADQVQSALAEMRAGTNIDDSAMAEFNALEMRCAGADALTAQFTGQVVADLREAAQKWMNGSLSDARYLTLLADRQAKLEAFRSDEGFRAAYARGDRDRDLVPDELDRCPSSGLLSTTDDEGCVYDCGDLTHSESRIVDARQCQAWRRRTDSDSRALLKSLVPFNPHCDASTQPSPSAPLGWTDAVLKSRSYSPTQRVEVRGLRIFAVRIQNPNPSCEIFYEFDVRLQTLSEAIAKVEPTALHMLFSEREDARPDNPDIITFEIPVERLVISSSPVSLSVTNALPPSSGRSEFARRVAWRYKYDGLPLGYPLLLHADPRWRVRTVNGIGASSDWSEVRSHSKGTDQTQ